MSILALLSGMICICLGWLYARLCADIRALQRQLDEIDRGSHMELAVNSRQKCLLAFCRKLNQVLSSKDTEHVQYERAEKQLKQNITNLAHDIRTPLTGASGYVQLAGECEDPEKRTHYLQAAETRLAELADMLEKLFLYTKLTSDDFSLPPERMKNIPVLPLLGGCLLSLYSQFEKAGTAPRVSFQSENLCVFAEEDALRRIFLNLIQNALIHGSGGISITQTANPPISFSGSETSRQNGVFLIFENPAPKNFSIDTGHIFDRFYKADTARGKGSSGLGLFIVKELMEKMGGTVTADTDSQTVRIILFFPT